LTPADGGARFQIRKQKLPNHKREGKGGKRMRQIQTAAFGLPEYEVQPRWTYRPRVKPHLVRKLWELKVKTGKPMTELLSEALERYLADREGR
jgi:hypothetical protein